MSPSFDDTSSWRPSRCGTTNLYPQSASARVRVFSKKRSGPAGNEREEEERRRP